MDQRTEAMTYSEMKRIPLRSVSDGVHFRCGNKNLEHPWTDLDETFRVYRVDLETMQGHIFDFRSEVKTGSEPPANDNDVIST